jgi:hypothetical protein
MSIFVGVCITVLLSLSFFGIGVGIVRALIPAWRGALWMTASALIGIYMGVWSIYLLSSILRSLDWATIVVIIGGLWALSQTNISRIRRDARTQPWWKWGVLGLMVAVSTWIMVKPLQTAGGMFLIGSNEVFDYAHAISIIRSFSYGANIPYSSPFVAETPHVYHFLFYLWAAVLERWGMPIVWAFNVPSVMVLSLFLLMVMHMGRFLFGKLSIGLLACALVLTHSTLTFWYFLRDSDHVNNLFTSVWRNASYYFAGPYDGSQISIFWTLNVLVNQRHLVFGMAMALALYMLAVYLLSRKNDLLLGRRMVLVGFLCGCMVWWHTTLFIAVVWIIGWLCILSRRYKLFTIFLFVASGVGLAHSAAWLAQIPAVRATEGAREVLAWFVSSDALSWAQYWWQNLGVAILTIPLGYMLLPKEKRILILPFVMLFVVANGVRFGRDMAENHKFLTLVFAVGSMLSAGSVLYVRKRLGIVIAIIVLALLSASGVIDVMVLKNDFQYPVADFKTSKFMQWIRDETPPTAVFLSYQDMFDPVVMSGRKTYFGFFGAKAHPARSTVVRQVYEATAAADLRLLVDYGISYVVVPKCAKADFSYIVNMDLYRAHMRVVYEDEQHVVFAAPSSDRIEEYYDSK